MNYWKVNCMEDQYPGLWQTWFLQQAVAIGWPTPHHSLNGPTDDSGWSAARAAAIQVEVGDWIVVQLSDSRVGRIGSVTGVKVEDADWNPTVPIDKEHPEGEMGRRIEVRWDLQVGPVSPSAVARLPVEARFKGRALRSTIVRLRDETAMAITEALSDEANWTTVHSRFASERAISEYINSFSSSSRGRLTSISISENARVFLFRQAEKRRTSLGSTGEPGYRGVQAKRTD